MRGLLYFYPALKQNEMNEKATRILMPHEEIANLIEDRIDPLEIGTFLNELHKELCNRADNRLQEKRDDAAFFERKYYSVRNAFEPQIQKADKY